MIFERRISIKYTLMSIVFILAILQSVTGCSLASKKISPQTTNKVSTDLITPETTENTLFSNSLVSASAQNNMQPETATHLGQINIKNSITTAQPTANIMSNTYSEKTSPYESFTAPTPIIPEKYTNRQEDNSNNIVLSSPTPSISIDNTPYPKALRPGWVKGYPKITYKEIIGNPSPIYTYHFNVNTAGKLYLAVLSINSDISPETIKEITLTGKSKVLRSRDKVFDHIVFNTKGYEEIVKAVQIGMNEEKNIYTAIESNEGVLVLGTLNFSEN